MKKLICLIPAAALLAACSTGTEPAGVGSYPATAKVDTVDTYFGTDVEDPYRWLESDTARATAEWIQAQNQVTFGYLDRIPYRDVVKKRLMELFNYERVSSPDRHGDYYYYSRNDGLQNQSVQYRKKGLDGTEEVFLDPNAFSKDGTSALGGISFSRDGSLCAYMISEGGSDWRKAVVIRTSDKQVLEDTLRDIRFSGISWRGNEGFYYSRYDREKSKGSNLTATTDFHKLFFHKLGTPQSTDVMIFGGEAAARRYVGAYLTEDERFLVVTAATGTYGNELYLQDLRDPKGKLTPAVSNLENNNYVLANEGDRLIFGTDYKAPKNRIVAATWPKVSREYWTDLIPETENVAESINTAGKKIFVSYLQDAKTQVKQFDYNGKFERDIELPGIGTAFGFGGREEESTVYYSFTSFTYPSTIFSYDIPTGKSALYIQPKVQFSPSEYETEQVFYNSKDGTRVPMFITYKKGTEKNGKNPTILYGYGGFGSSSLPSFNTSRVVWLENGGVYALACIRGGGEYGEAWHQAGTKMNKQNVFDDFIAAGEYLIANKYTSSDYLALQGGSNGGLLVGAVMTQRPELAKVALPAVGVMDMLRFHKFLAGIGWSTDYGNADESREMFEYLRGYSPYHNLKPGVSYPATLVTTADHDDRVVPAHSFKFAARLQEYHKGYNPVLIRIDTKSGHGASNLTKSIETTTDLYSFTWYNMGYIPPIAR
jgi:prolyl oligopeptidase